MDLTHLVDLDKADRRDLLSVIAHLLENMPGHRAEIPINIDAVAPDAAVTFRRGTVDPDTLVIEMANRERSPEASDILQELSEHGTLHTDPASTGEVLDMVVWLVEGSARGGGDRTDAEVVEAIWEVVHDKPLSDLDGSSIHWGEIGKLAMRATMLEEQLGDARLLIEDFFRPGPGPATMEISDGWAATGYQLDLLANTVNAGVWNLRVEHRGRGAWAVLHHSQCLSSDGEWDWEPQPSSRTDEWKRTHRFDLVTALLLGQQHYNDLAVNGATPAEALAEHQRRQEAKNA